MGLTKDKMKKYSPEFKLHWRYVMLCEDMGLKPCDFNEFQIHMALINGHDKHVYIPYISNTGNVWVRKLGNKTRRTDRPINFVLANL